MQQVLLDKPDSLRAVCYKDYTWRTTGEPIVASGLGVGTRKLGRRQTCLPCDGRTRGRGGVMEYPPGFGAET